MRKLILLIVAKLISVISLLSQNRPDLDSPANVDAAKEVRDDFSCKRTDVLELAKIELICLLIAMSYVSVQEKGSSARAEICGRRFRIENGLTVANLGVWTPLQIVQ